MVSPPYEEIYGQKVMTTPHYGSTFGQSMMTTPHYGPSYGQPVMTSMGLPFFNMWSKQGYTSTKIQSSRAPLKSKFEEVDEVHWIKQLVIRLKKHW